MVQKYSKTGTLNHLQGLLSLMMIIALAQGCASKKKAVETSPNPQPGTESSRPHNEPRPGGRVDQILRTALREWEFFGRQTVLIHDDQESIPTVGKWEDEGDIWADRINLYWRSVDKPRLDGYDCKQPWSAAFISWVMSAAGLSDWEFPGSDAHWNYIRYFESHKYTNTAFVTHPIKEYTPKAGDLICATRGNSGFIPVYDAMDTSSVLMGHAKLHCDIVTHVGVTSLEAVGGNVRNSVSKTIIDIGTDGKLKPSERRPWFVTLENRLEP